MEVPNESLGIGSCEFRMKFSDGSFLPRERLFQMKECGGCFAIHFL